MQLDVSPIIGWWTKARATRRVPVKAFLDAAANDGCAALAGDKERLLETREAREGVVYVVKVERFRLELLCDKQNDRLTATSIKRVS